MTQHYSSFKEESDPFALHNSSIMPFVIKGLAMTETANHISGRSLILLSNENKLYNVPQNLFSARRPGKDDIEEPKGWFTMPDPEDLEKMFEEKPFDKQLKHVKYLPYQTVMPTYDQRWISYDLRLTGLEKIKTFPTRLESTSQVLAYGHDLFLVRVTPDKKFDMIDEEFNYALLFLVIGALMTAVYVLRRWIDG